MFTPHNPSAFELNLAQVIIQILYATSQNTKLKGNDEQTFVLE